MNPAVNAITILPGRAGAGGGRQADRSRRRRRPPAAARRPVHRQGEHRPGRHADDPRDQGARGRLPEPGRPRRRADAGRGRRSRSAAPTCPTFAIRWHTDSELWGATINPWDRSRTPGASSGGEAAALATGMTPLGLGNDTLGSLRWPPSAAGSAALKPTLGRIPHATTIEPVDMPIGDQLPGVDGPMARRVADLRAAFEATAGPTWRDPWTCPHRCAARTSPAHPGRRRPRPGRAGHRHAGAGRCPRRRPRRSPTPVTRSRRPSPRHRPGGQDRCWTCSTPGPGVPAGSGRYCRSLPKGSGFSSGSTWWRGRDRLATISELHDPVVAAAGLGRVPGDAGR